MKHLFKVLGGAVLLLLVAYVAANVTSGRSLENELSGVRERGEPLSLKEAAPPPLPDAENAALVYHRAFEKLPKFTGQEEKVLARFGDPKTESDKEATPEAIRPVLSKADEALALATDASQMPRCRFPVNYEAGAGALFPHLGHLREIARLWAARARLRAMESNPSGAMDDIAALLSMAQQLNDEPTMITRLNQFATIAQANRGLRSVLAVSSPAQKEEQRLYDQISKFDLYSAFVRSLEGERTFGLWIFDALRKDPAQLAMFDGGDDGVKVSKLAKIPGYRLLSGPYLKKDESFYLQLMDREIEWAKEHRRPKKMLQKPATNRSVFTEDDIQFPWYALTSKMIMPSFAVAADKRDQAIATLSLLQGALALHIYKQQAGRYPSALADVTAKTGMELNKDPFTGQDLRYRREGNGYLLYSIGPNGKDDGGWASNDSSAPDYPGRRRRLGQGEDDVAFWTNS